MNISSRKQNEIIVFDIEGEIRRSDISDITLHQLVKDQLDAGNKKILLNFDKVEFIDSFGVGEIVSSFISIKNLGGMLLRANTPRKIQMIFKVTMLEPIIPNHESIEMALEGFQTQNHEINE